MCCEQTKFRGERIVIADEHPTITHPTEVFGWVETQATGDPPATRGTAIPRGSNRLGRILDHGDSVLSCDLANLVHRSALSEQVDRNNGPRTGGDALAERFGIDIVRFWIDVHEDRFCPQPSNSAGGGKEREARNDHLVPWLDIECHERQK